MLNAWEVTWNITNYGHQKGGSKVNIPAKKRGLKLMFFLKYLKKVGLKSIFFSGTLKKGNLKSILLPSVLKKVGLYHGAYPSPSHNQYTLWEPHPVLFCSTPHIFTTIPILGPHFSGMCGFQPTESIHKPNFILMHNHLIMFESWLLDIHLYIKITIRVEI